MKSMDLGVILDPSGKVDASQVWNVAGIFTRLADNVRMTAQPAAGDFNVWIPPTEFAYTGHPNLSAFPNGAYLSFKTHAEARADVQTRGFGVLLDKKGKPEAKQEWGQAGPAIAQLENGRLQPTPTAKQYNVWFPASHVSALGVANATPFQSGGAYLSYPTLAEAVEHVKQRTYGLVLNPKGDVAANQPWALSSTSYNELPGVNARLSAKPTAGKHHVWFPTGYLSSISVQNTGQYPSGAWLAFDSSADAQVEATRRQMGVVVDPKGKAEAKQPWPNAPQLGAQLENPRFTTQATPGKHNVWFPPQYVSSTGETGPEVQQRRRVRDVRLGRRRASAREGARRVGRHPRPDRPARREAALESGAPVRGAAGKRRPDEQASGRQGLRVDPDSSTWAPTACWTRSPSPTARTCRSNRWPRRRPT